MGRRGSSTRTTRTMRTMRRIRLAQSVLALPHSENELIPWSQGLRPSQQLLLDLLPHELQPPSKKTHTSSPCLLRQLDLRQMAGLDEKECKQSARRSRGGQSDYQRNRQESDDLNTKGSIPLTGNIDVFSLRGLQRGVIWRVPS